MSTLKIALSLLTILLGIAVVAAADAAERRYSTPVIRAAFGCTFSDGRLICGPFKKHRRSGGLQGGDEGGVMEDEPPCHPGGAAGLTKSRTPCDARGGHNGKKKKKDVDVGSEGERSCPPGYVVLKEKNKYGAFCEPKEGFPAEAGGEQGGAGPVPAASRNVCCKPGEGGPYFCSSDSTPPEAEAQIRSLLKKQFPEGHVTCAPERAQGGIPPGF
ncbi:exported hypothetical protein [Mesorhizobium sp. ORS 3324]|nr:exported hypothetical protein [Mesorhizobium sp. ORS 3324]